ncbi:MAG: PKD domain-containing protein [Bacteroidia bacterium]
MYKVDTIEYIPDFFDSVFCVNNADSVQIKLVNTTKILTGAPESFVQLERESRIIYKHKYESDIECVPRNLYGRFISGWRVFDFKTITIDSLPHASFTVVDSVCQETPVLFNNTSTGSSSSLWMFGDGASSLLTSPIRSYTSSGLYTATLEISNALGCTDTAMRSVLVLPHNLTGLIVAGGPLKFCEGDSVLLSSSISGGYPAYNYLWSTIETSSSIWANQTGNYNLEVMDSKGCFIRTANTNVLVKTKPHRISLVIKTFVPITTTPML